MPNPNDLPKEIQEIRERIFDLITDPPCRICDWWDVQGHYCFLKSSQPDSKRCDLMNQLLKFGEFGNVVVLAEDQTPLLLHLPDEQIETYPALAIDRAKYYKKGQQDAEREGWRKVLNLDGTPIGGSNDQKD